MKVTLLNAGTMPAILNRLIRDHDEIQIAVAWGYNGTLADRLMENKEKFRSVTFGLNGFATSPDLVERLIGTKNAFIAKADKGIFHPKLYLFRTGSKAEAIVGSANFTNGGLGLNHEACLHIEGSVNNEIFDQIQSELSGYDPLKQRVTQVLADSYRRQFEAARKRRGQRDPILPDDRKSGKGLTSSLAKMNWDEFARTAKLDPHHHFKRRMKLLRAVQRLFASAGRFSDLSVTECKGIAGTLGNAEKEAAGLGDHDWGWFGSMGGNGDFAGLIAKQDRRLGAALDCIPRKDPVTLEDFTEYCRKFRKAFVDAQAHHVGEYPTATRLLAMKRPDTFVCANGKNKANLAKALSFAPTTLALENYWDRVIVPIQSSPWYNAPRPDGDDSELWDYRVAMLDTIYYNEHA
ncbi:phospholipase D family protein [Ensifer sp. ENS10]|uniref:phospholipase D family protein n=1 Tax=Ensifer sp. ENS10 TaxID=2769286 RepID=UPI00177F185F|nr:phospholipase D family protein [Ensifer sp. ENS10]MBD9511982.1 phospholipase D family protein [Ensifer sp. ENS10]